MSPRTPILAKVKTTEPLTPHMVRIVLQSEGLRGFPVGEFTDHYVKLQLPPPGASYSAPFDPAQIRESLGRDQWHRQRTYTVRDADPEAGEITIDFVTHGSGLAGPWARDAAAGDLIQLVGPGGAYTPDPEADWHLLAGTTPRFPRSSPPCAGSLPQSRPWSCSRSKTSRSSASSQRSRTSPRRETCGSPGSTAAAPDTATSRGSST